MDLPKPSAPLERIVVDWFIIVFLAPGVSQGDIDAMAFILSLSFGLGLEKMVFADGFMNGSSFRRETFARDKLREVH